MDLQEDDMLLGGDAWTGASPHSPAPASDDERGNKKRKSADGKAKAAAKKKARSSTGGVGKEAETEEERASTGTATGSAREDKSLAGQKKASKLYSKRCKGCHLYFQPQGMGTNSPYCLKDKHKMDQLTRMAKSQGKSEWLRDIKSDEDKCFKVLKAYAEATGNDGAGSKRKAWGGLMRFASGRVFFIGAWLLALFALAGQSFQPLPVLGGVGCYAEGHV